MAIFQNLVARLSLDSTAFDRNARKSSSSMKSMQRQSLALQRRVLQLAGAYIGVRGLSNALRSVVRAGAEQEAAEKRLQAALESTGDYVASNFKHLKDYAAQIQQVTTYGDEAILNQMAYARSLGITSNQLGAVTQGAIGLATALDMDLKTAMRYTATAMQGEFTMLRRYIPELRRTTDAGEQFAIIQRKMAEGFRQAQAETETMAGSAAQLANTWGDTKEIIAEAIAEPLTDGLRGLNQFLEQNQSGIRRWAQDWVDGAEIVRDAIRGATSQRNIRSLYEGLGPSMQKSIQQAYESSRPDKFGMHTSIAGGGMGGGAAAEIYYPPQDEAYAMKLLEAYTRAQGQRAGLSADETMTKLRQRLGQIGAAPMGMGAISPIAPGETAAAGTTATGGAAVVKETEKITSDIAATYRRMFSDLDRNTQESWQLRKVLLIQELKENLKAAEDQAAVWRWYEEQRTKLARERDIALGSIEDGFTARLAQMHDELETTGQLGANLADSLRDGLVGSLTDAVFEARNLGDALEETARSMAKLAFQWGMNQIVTGGLNAAFGVQSAHGGGTIGGAVQVKRPSVPLPFVGAPRFHNGGEVPAWLQSGERVQSRAQVAAGDRANARIVQLLERLVASERGTTVINSFDPADIVEKAAQTRRGQRAIMNLVGRNQ